MTRKMATVRMTLNIHYFYPGQSSNLHTGCVIKVAFSFLLFRRRSVDAHHHSVVSLIGL